MKKNWIRGLDRVAILMAVPFAICCGAFMSNVNYNNKILYSFRPELTTSYYMMTPNVQDYGIDNVRNWGFSDSEIIQYMNKKNEARVPRIEEGLKKGFNLRDVKVISPVMFERTIIGLLWAIPAGLIFIFVVSASTRGIPTTIRWLRSGFGAEEIVKSKKKK